MFKRIVAGVSRTQTAKEVGAEAIDLANGLEAELHLVACFDESERRQRPVDKHLQATLDSLVIRANGPVETHVLPGNPVDTLLDIAERGDADLIVVGNKGTRGASRVLGSVATSITHRSNCAVLIVATT